MKHINCLKSAFVFLWVCGLSGCGLQYLPDEVKAPKDAELPQSYYKTVLKQSSSADVLSVIHKPKYELLSQSESVVASWGQKKEGRKMWFNMVAFDQELLTAKRKYFFLFDENVPYWPWRQKCRLDMEMVADVEILEKPYANENARRMAVLRRVLENFNKDVFDVRQDNKMLDSCAMLVNQVLNTILVQLDEMPVRASELSDLSGMAFDHTTLGRGRIRMVIRDDVVKVKVKIGRSLIPFKKHHDVIGM